MRKRSEKVESPGTYATVCFTLPLLLGAVFFQTTLPCAGGYHLERGGMSLHDVVGINCATTETKVRVSRIQAKECMFDCVGVI